MIFPLSSFVIPKVNEGHSQSALKPRLMDLIMCHSLSWRGDIFKIIQWLLYCNLSNLQTDQGVKNLPADRAEVLAGSDPDYNNRMLYNAIADGKPVSFLVSVHRC